MPGLPILWDPVPSALSLPALWPHWPPCFSWNRTGTVVLGLDWLFPRPGMFLTRKPAHITASPLKGLSQMLLLRVAFPEHTICSYPPSVSTPGLPTSPALLYVSQHKYHLPTFHRMYLVLSLSFIMYLSSLAPIPTGFKLHKGGDFC